MEEFMGAIIWFGFVLLLMAVSNRKGKKNKNNQKSAPTVRVTEEQQNAQAMPADVMSTAPTEEQLDMFLPEREPYRGSLESAQESFRGSMDVDTGEGEDITHGDHFHSNAPAAYAAEPLEVEEDTPRSPLDLTPNAMVNAIIMQEVLTRPKDRKRAY